MKLKKQNIAAFSIRAAIFMILFATAGCGVADRKGAVNSNANSAAADSSASSISVPGSEASSSALASAASSKSDSAGEEVQKKKGFIRAFNEETGILTLDPIEWLTLQDKDRLRELGISEDNFPNGFYIYNPSQQTENLMLSSQTKIYLLSGTPGEGVLTDRAGLTERLKKAVNNPYELQIQNGTVIQVDECYLP